MPQLFIIFNITLVGSLLLSLLIVGQSAIFKMADQSTINLYAGMGGGGGGSAIYKIVYGPVSGLYRESSWSRVWGQRGDRKIQGDVKRCVATGDRTRVSGISHLRHNH